MPKEPSDFTVKYGMRVIVPLGLFLLVAILFLVLYFNTGRSDDVLLGLFFVFLIVTVLLFFGFRITISHRITKKYFHTEALIGQKGRVIKGVPAKTYGTLNVLNEDWSFICDSDTSDNQVVTVAEVMEDTATLRVTISS
ncbi:MAG: NfeD family protein [Candidatus Thermoplasmatota archaeon]|jgi:membrane protein implicated in regulation of membrane protease activity|nr:NfeD family protein [Candidatus Thermoplasmatota archaeon]